jgi:hypothetical protein
MPIVRWILLQTLSFALQMIGAVILIPLCWYRQWVPSFTSQGLPSKLGQRIFVWHPMLWIFSNDEDGVTGPADYNPTLSRWKAYVWSAWRNPVDNFKYLRFTQRQGGPLYEFSILGWQRRIGWNEHGFIVG